VISASFFLPPIIDETLTLLRNDSPPPAHSKTFYSFRSCNKQCIASRNNHLRLSAQGFPLLYCLVAISIESVYGFPSTTGDRWSSSRYLFGTSNTPYTAFLALNLQECTRGSFNRLLPFERTGKSFDRGPCLSSYSWNLEHASTTSRIVHFWGVSYIPH